MDVGEVPSLQDLSKLAIQHAPDMNTDRTVCIYDKTTQQQHQRLNTAEPHTRARHLDDSREPKSTTTESSADMDSQHEMMNTQGNEQSNDEVLQIRSWHKVDEVSEVSVDKHDETNIKIYFELHQQKPSSSFEEISAAEQRSGMLTDETSSQNNVKNCKLDHHSQDHEDNANRDEMLPVHGNGEGVSYTSNTDSDNLRGAEETKIGEPEAFCRTRKLLTECMQPVPTENATTEENLTEATESLIFANTMLLEESEHDQIQSTIPSTESLSSANTMVKEESEQDQIQTTISSGHKAIEEYVVEYQTPADMLPEEFAQKSHVHLDVLSNYEHNISILDTAENLTCVDRTHEEVPSINIIPPVVNSTEIEVIDEILCTTNPTKDSTFAFAQHGEMSTESMSKQQTVYRTAESMCNKDIAQETFHIEVGEEILQGPRTTRGTYPDDIDTGSLSSSEEADSVVYYNIAQDVVPEHSDKTGTEDWSTMKEVDEQHLTDEMVHGHLGETGLRDLPSRQDDGVNHGMAKDLVDNKSDIDTSPFTVQKMSETHEDENDNTTVVQQVCEKESLRPYGPAVDSRGRGSEVMDSHLSRPHEEEVETNLEVPDAERENLKTDATVMQGSPPNKDNTEEATQNVYLSIRDATECDNKMKPRSVDSAVCISTSSNSCTSEANVLEVEAATEMPSDDTNVQDDHIPQIEQLTEEQKTTSQSINDSPTEHSIDIAYLENETLHNSKPDQVDNEELDDKKVEMETEEDERKIFDLTSLTAHPVHHTCQQDSSSAEEDESPYFQKNTSDQEDLETKTTAITEPSAEKITGCKESDMDTIHASPAESPTCLHSTSLKSSVHFASPLEEFIECSSLSSSPSTLLLSQDEESNRLFMMSTEREVKIYEHTLRTGNIEQVDLIVDIEILMEDMLNAIVADDCDRIDLSSCCEDLSIDHSEQALPYENRTHGSQDIQCTSPKKLKPLCTTHPDLEQTSADTSTYTTDWKLEDSKIDAVKEVVDDVQEQLECGDLELLAVVPSADMKHVSCDQSSCEVEYNVLRQSPQVNATDRVQECKQVTDNDDCSETSDEFRDDEGGHTDAEVPASENVPSAAQPPEHYDEDSVQICNACVMTVQPDDEDERSNVQYSTAGVTNSDGTIDAEFVHVEEVFEDETNRCMITNCMDSKSFDAETLNCLTRVHGLESLDDDISPSKKLKVAGFFQQIQHAEVAAAQDGDGFSSSHQMEAVVPSGKAKVSERDELLMEHHDAALALTEGGPPEDEEFYLFPGNQSPYSCDADFKPLADSPLSHSVEQNKSVVMGSPVSDRQLSPGDVSTKAFRWKYAPSLEFDDVKPLQEEDQEDRPALVGPLHTCSKPVRVGLSKKQRVKRLHPYFKNHN